MTNTKNERAARIASLQAELDFLKLENQKDHENGVELADMIANANHVSRFRVEQTGGDVYILLAGSEPSERLSFKLDRDIASDFVVRADDVLQELDETPAATTPTELKENAEYVFKHPTIEALLMDIFGPPKNEKSA
jgi:hypothetical protein